MLSSKGTIPSSTGQSSNRPMKSVRPNECAASADAETGEALTGDHRTLSRHVAEFNVNGKRRFQSGSRSIGPAIPKDRKPIDDA